MRIYFTGTQALYQYSTNGGNTWLTDRTEIQTQEQMWLKVQGMFAGSQSLEITVSGLSILKIKADKPIINANDITNRLVVSSPQSDHIVYSIDNGVTWVQYVGAIDVGDVDLPSGYYWFKVAETSLFDESDISYSPEFTQGTVEKETLPVIFSGLENVMDNLGTYLAIENGIVGYGWNSGVSLPVNIDGGIYFNGNSTRAWVGLHTSNGKTEYWAAPIAVIFNEWGQVTVYDHHNQVEHIATVHTGARYRIYGRNGVDGKQFRLEMSTDNWLTYAVLYTFALDSNTLYPFIQLLGSNNAQIGELSQEGMV